MPIETRRPEQDPYRTKTGELIPRKAGDNAPKSFQEMTGEERQAYNEEMEAKGTMPLPIHGYARDRIVVGDGIEEQKGKSVEVEEKADKGKVLKKHRREDSDILS